MALSQRDVDDRRNELQPCLHPSTKAQWPLLKSACQKQTLLTVQWAVQCFDRGPNSAVRYSLCNFQLPPRVRLSPPPPSPPSPPSRVRSPPLGLPLRTWKRRFGFKAQGCVGGPLSNQPLFSLLSTWPQISSSTVQGCRVEDRKKSPLGKVSLDHQPPRDHPPPTRRYRPRFTLFLALLYGCLIFILDLVVPLYPSSPLINRLASTFSLSLFFFFVHSLSTLFFSTTKVDHRLR